MGPSYKTKIQQKRGLGTKGAYIPWIKVGEFSNMGHSSRIKGLISGREHHFHSNLEAGLFYMLDLNPKVSDIREQFPLLDINLAKEIALQAGIKYPHISDNEPHILTTDFLIDFNDNRQLAITIKPIQNITKRQLELFEIERRYWEANEIKWIIATESELASRNYSLNCKDMHNCLRGFIQEDFQDELLQDIKTQIVDLHPNLSELTIPKFSSYIDNELGLTFGTTLRFIKSLIAKGLIQTNLETSITKIKIEHMTLKFNHETAIGKSDLAA
ncbi:MAG: TnsA endonuclease N-terminal domain-containing protein [Reichenbachiella sp.]|uniref:TnsA endonuclease N-terminal domain-containing protein n=1 Tax=Reichenbachiella sp. TaxID=2184521 RepID=UPI003296AE7B